MILETSRRGAPTARLGSRYIHSKYDPEREACQLFENFRSSSEYSSDKYLIILEPGLGYILTEALKYHKPDRIMVLFYSTDTYRYCLSRDFPEDLHLFNPEEDLEAFLTPLAGKVDLRDLLFLEFPSAASIFQEEQKYVRSRIMQTLSINQGSEMTRQHFAGRWYLNSIRNFLYLDSPEKIIRINGPVILTASGPTLESSLDLIGRNRERAVIAALPSSLRALKERGIVPDILFSTDPGYYAREHLKYLEKNTVVISPLTAAMNTPENRICCIDQKSYVERLLLNQGEMEHIPEMGTVAATALNFILSRSTSNVYVAGLDLCMSDISMHIRPHSFDPIILAGESRFKTGYGEYYSRAAAMTHSLTGRYRLTRAMNTYSSWFSGQNFGNRVFRINPTPVDLPFNDLSSLESLNEILNESVKKEIFFEPDRAYPEAEVRKERVRRLAESLQSELEEFISTGRSGRFLTEFASEVMPVSLAGLKEDSSKEDFLCRMDKLIDSTEGILNGQ